MAILQDILTTLPQGQVQRVCCGVRWTVVAVQVGDELRCGMASTLAPPGDLPPADELVGRPARPLAEMALSERPGWASVGLATINALLPKWPPRWAEQDAQRLLAERSAGKRLVMVGHFPFVDRLRGIPASFHILEKRPRPGDLAEHQAPQVLPGAEVVAITAMTLHNHTLEPLLNLCSEKALVLLLGPSTPLSPVLFDYGIHLLCGVVVTDMESVLQAAAHATRFRRLRQAGIKRVVLGASDFPVAG